MEVGLGAVPRGIVGLPRIPHRYGCGVRPCQTLRNYSSKMVHYDLVEAVRAKRGRTYRLAGEPEV